MVDPYAIVRRLTGHELISPKDARLLTEAVDGLIGEIGSKDARIAELEAEVERLTKEAESYRDIAARKSNQVADMIHTEALSRTGAVKVEGPRRCATEGCDQPATNEFIRGDVGSFYCGDCFGKVIEVCEARPAPESQQDDEPVAWQWRAYEGGGAVTDWHNWDWGDRRGWEAIAKRDPGKYEVRSRPLYAHPTERAVTEAMVEAVVQAVRPYTMHALFIDEHRELVRDALKAAQEGK